MSTRRLLAAGGALVALLIAGLVWELRERPTHTGATRSEPATLSSPTPSSATPSSATASSATTIATRDQRETASASVGDTEHPQPVPLDPSVTPPPADAPHSQPAPPQKPFTRDETIAKRQADLKLLDETKTRLEKDLATAKTNHDATATHDLEIRLARLAALKKKRGTELEQIRAGGALPP